MIPEGYASCDSKEALLTAVETLILCEHPHMFTVRQEPSLGLDNLSDLALECLTTEFPNSSHIVAGHIE